MSSYLELAEADLSEAEFVATVAERADCLILLDVNNVYVSARNHGFDAHAYLDAIPRTRVGQIHLAGHSAHGALLIDTHDHPVCEEVWALYRYAVNRFGDVATLLERDAELPPWQELVAELERARTICSQARAA